MVKFIPKSNSEKSRRMILENLLIQERFPFLTTRMAGNRLVSRGRIQPTETSAVYRIEVCYEPWSAPEVRVLEPAIKSEGKLHFYKNGTLCLYDWREQPWEKRLRLADTVIPWTAEWLLFYEIYLLTGKWIGASVAHGDVKVEEPKPDSQTSEQERVE
jgi:hypothetical protein